MCFGFRSAGCDRDKASLASVSSVEGIDGASSRQTGVIYAGVSHTDPQSWASNPNVRVRMQRQKTRDTQPELALLMALTENPH